MFGFFQNTQDPVCKMKVNKKEAKFSSEYNGEKHYFCSNNCQEKFKSDPKKYINQEKSDHGCCGHH